MGNVWTVARQTIAESIRMKIAVVLLVLLGVLVLGLPFASQGDGSVSGSVQSFLAYSVATVSFLLSCLTIFLSKTVSDDLVGKQILILMTKPIARWQYVVGKWVGILGLNTGILIIAGGTIYAMTMYLASQPPRDDADAQRLATQILKARHSTNFILPKTNFKKTAEAVFEKNLEQGRYTEMGQLDAKEEAREKNRLSSEVEKRWRTIWPGEYREFEFEDVRCDRSPGSLIHIKYEYRVYSYPPDEIIRCMWIVGDREKNTGYYEIPRRDAMERRHTMAIPADAVADDNTLRVTFVNYNPYAQYGEQPYPYTIVFDGPDSVQVLFSVSSFGSNLVRALSLVFCRLAFLTALAIAATTVFSFPVACLVALSVYTLASTRQFLGDAISYAPTEGIGSIAQVALNLMLAGVYFIIPNFAKYDGLSVLVDGRNVTLMWVLQGLGNLVLIKTGILLAIGCLLFHRREVSEISV